MKKIIWLTVKSMNSSRLSRLSPVSSQLDGEKEKMNRKEEERRKIVNPK